MECNEGVYTYNFTYDGKNALWAFRALRRNGTWTYLVQDAEVTPTTPQKFEEMDNRNGKVFRYSGLRAGRNYTIKLNCNNNEVSIVKNVTSIESEIPVYPNGVSTESELKAYNFEANPVYYLVAQVLNNDRPTPEWQMEKVPTANTTSTVSLCATLIASATTTPMWTVWQCANTHPLTAILI